MFTFFRDLERIYLKPSTVLSTFASFRHPSLLVTYTYPFLFLRLLASTTDRPNVRTDTFKMTDKADEIKVTSPAADFPMGFSKDGTSMTSVNEVNLQQTLKDRHLSMIAIGGALETGLVVETTSSSSLS